MTTAHAAALAAAVHAAHAAHAAATLAAAAIAAALAALAAGDIPMAWVASHQPNRSVLMAWLGWSCEPVDLANNVTPPYIQTIHKYVT